MEGKMNTQTQENYLPAFMVNHSQCDRSEAIPVEGIHYLYDGNDQIAVSLECMARTPSGYHTKMGQDWVTTDESFITPGPDGPN